MTVFIGVPNVMFSCQSYTNWSTILEHTNLDSVMTMDIYLIIINKDCKALATKNRPKRLINGNLKWKKMQNIRKMPTDFLVQTVS